MAPNEERLFYRGKKKRKKKDLQIGEDCWESGVSRASCLLILNFCTVEVIIKCHLSFIAIVVLF